MIGLRGGEGGAREGAGRKKGVPTVKKTLRKFLQDELAAKIDAETIIDKLESCVKGDIELSTQQIAAARILLDKAMSNAPTRTEHSGANGGDIPIAVKVVFTNAA